MVVQGEAIADVATTSPCVLRPSARRPALSPAPVPQSAPTRTSRGWRAEPCACGPWASPAPRPLTRPRRTASAAAPGLVMVAIGVVAVPVDRGSLRLDFDDLPASSTRNSSEAALASTRYSSAATPPHQFRHSPKVKTRRSQRRSNARSRSARTRLRSCVRSQS